MKEINIKNAYVCVPEDWIVLPDIVASAEECKYAYAVECRNPHGAYNDVPHLVACGTVPASELTDEMQEQIYAACAEADEHVGELMRVQRQTEASLKDSSHLTPEELERWDHAPIFGIFPIAEEDVEDAPCGAVIVREK